MTDNFIDPQIEDRNLEKGEAHDHAVKQLTLIDLQKNINKFGSKYDNSKIFIHHIGGISGVFQVTGIREDHRGLMITTMANPEKEKEIKTVGDLIDIITNQVLEKLNTTTNTNQILTPSTLEVCEECGKVYRKDSPVLRCSCGSTSLCIYKNLEA